MGRLRVGLARPRSQSSRQRGRRARPYAPCCGPRRPGPAGPWQPARTRGDRAELGRGAHGRLRPRICRHSAPLFSSRFPKCLSRLEPRL
ncbi:mCG147892 [Mus musculus]|nr:mCG147892 [Mus musculus]